MSKVLLVCKGARLHKILGPAMFVYIQNCENVRDIFNLPSERHMDLYVALIASSCLTLWSETGKLLNKLGLLGGYGHQWKFGTNCISLKNYTPIIVICYNMTSSFRVCSKRYKVHVSGDLKILN